MSRRIAQLLFLMIFLWIPVRGQDIGNLIRDGKIREAKSILAKAEKDNPSAENLPFLRGLLSIRGDSAEYFYEAYLNKTPDGPFSDEAQFRLGQLKYAQGLYRSAQKRFFQIIKNHPLSPFKPKCLYWSGMCHLAVGHKDSAEVLFRQLNREYPASEFKNKIPEGVSVADGIRDSVPNGVTSGVTPGQPVQAPPPEAPQKTATASYSVQIGAFSNQNNAILRKAFFEREGYPVVLKSKRREDGVFYLVWLGTFPSWEEAKKFGETLKAKYGTSYTLVSE